MDPISVAGIVESSLGLGLQLGNAAKTLNDMVGKYKNAKLTVKSLVQNLDILQFTWTQIGQWFETYAEDESLNDGDLVKRVRGFLETGTMVMEAFEKDLLVYDFENLNFAQRSKLVWNENNLQVHQIRIRDQTLTMSLFLQAVKLPTPKARANMLRKSEDQFRKSYGSAYSTCSIVSSRLSVSTSQRHSTACSSQESMEYRPLSFEDKLFMSKVYMRNSKNMMIKKIFRVRSQSNKNTRETIPPMPDWDPIRNELDADSLLPSSQEVSIVSRVDNKIIKPYNYLEDRSQGSQNFDDFNKLAGRSTALLIQACEKGNSVLVAQLLVSGLDVHARFTGFMYHGYTAIHVAALYGHINVVQTLLDNSAYVDEEDITGKRRPLHFAAASRQRPMVEFLIGQGAQIDAKARNAVQPIHQASWAGSIEVLDALIGAGAAIDCSDIFGYQPLHWAILTFHQPEVIRYLVNRNADVEAKTSDGSRAVHLTCRTESKNLRTLLALGAKTDFDDGTDSALITAINSENQIAVEMLLKHGVDPNRRASDGSTAWHALARFRSQNLGESSNDKGIYQSLLGHGAHVHIKDENEYQVLHYSASQNSTSMADFVAMEELAKLVLARGADVDATTSQGYSPLYLALCRGNRQLSRLLIRSGSRVLIRTDVLCAELYVQVSDSQKPKHTVNVWRGSGGLREEWVRVPALSFELPMDDHGYIMESAMKEILVNLQRFFEFMPMVQ